MSEFDSPIGKKQINYNQQNFREFTVPDANDFEPLPQESISTSNFTQSQQNFQPPMQNTSRRREQSQQDISEGARRRVEMLLGMTRQTKKIKIQETDYELRSLKSIEMRKALSEASKYDGTVQMAFELRKQVLSSSLIGIGGVDIDMFLGTSDINAKYQLIDNLDEALLIRLYDEYTKLSSETNKKYSINSMEELKEVTEDIKKS